MNASSQIIASNPPRRRPGAMADRPCAEAAFFIERVRRAQESVSSARELIMITAEQEAVLRKRFSKLFVDSILKYRRDVLQEFESMLGQGQ